MDSWRKVRVHSLLESTGSTAWERWSAHAWDACMAK